MNPMSRLSLHFALVAGAVALSACGDDPVAPPQFEVIDEVEFAESLGIDLEDFTKTESGLYYMDVTVGEGETAVAGDSVTIAYEVFLRSGEQVDEGDFSFTLAAPDNTFRGVHEGVAGVNVGGERRLILPPHLADNVPGPEGILVFDFQLVSVGDTATTGEEP